MLLKLRGAFNLVASDEMNSTSLDSKNIVVRECEVNVAFGYVFYSAGNIVDTIIATRRIANYYNLITNICLVKKCGYTFC